MAQRGLRSSLARSISRNYKDLCRPTFQGEFVSQPPAEIRSVLNSSHSGEVDLCRQVEQEV